MFRDEYTLPSGTEVDDYYVIERDDFVLVVAEHNDRVALVGQYRPATERYYYSLPGGYLDGESPEVAARRELLEETGLEGEGFCTVGELHPYRVKSDLLLSSWFAAPQPKLLPFRTRPKSRVRGLFHGRLRCK